MTQRKGGIGRKPGRKREFRQKIVSITFVAAGKQKPAKKSEVDILTNQSMAFKIPIRIKIVLGKNVFECHPKPDKRTFNLINQLFDEQDKQGLLEQKIMQEKLLSKKRKNLLQTFTPCTKNNMTKK